jgi:hypothetical protein
LIVPVTVAPVRDDDVRGIDVAVDEVEWTPDRVGELMRAMQTGAQLHHDGGGDVHRHP